MHTRVLAPSFVWVGLLMIFAAFEAIFPDFASSVLERVGLFLVVLLLGGAAMWAQKREQDTQGERVEAQRQKEEARDLEAAQHRRELKESVDGIFAQLKRDGHIAPALEQARGRLIAKIIQPDDPNSIAHHARIANSRAGVLTDQQGRPIDGV